MGGLLAKRRKINHIISLGNAYVCLIQEFKEFIDDIDLVDIPCIGNEFTRFSGDGLSMSRLNKFILSDSILSRWVVVG